MIKNRRAVLTCFSFLLTLYCVFYSGRAMLDEHWALGDENELFISVGSS